MDVSFLKKNCGAEREGKKKKEKKWQRHCRNRGEKKKKLFCGNGIAEIEKKKSDKLICGNSIVKIDHNKVI